jgi:hypothetical protein
MSIANLKKGDSVILKGFTGIKLGVFQVSAATKKTVTILKKNGDEMIFDRKTGKQVNVEEGKEKYANSIMEDDGSYVAPATRGASKKKAAKKPTKPEPVEEDEEDEEDEDEDEEEEEPKPVKKPGKKTAKAAPAKKPSKKAAPVVEDDEDDEDDDDDFEEIDD